MNISSLFGLMGMPGQSAYNASKFAVRGFTEALRQEMLVARHPVQVSCVHPGGIKTAIARNARTTAGHDQPTVAEFFDRKLARTTAETAAQVIIDGILTDKPRIVVGTDAKVLDLAVRLVGARYQKAVAKVAGRVVPNSRAEDELAGPGIGYHRAMTKQHGLEQDNPGAEASDPRGIPARGWWQVSKRAWKESKTDQVPLLAAGVAFFAFLSLFPAMIAAVMVYGLVADPQTVAEQAEQITEALPEDAASLITGQMQAIIETPQKSLGLGLVIALVLALWSASGGVGNVITAINLAYDEDETRGFVKRKLLALAFTIGAILFAIVAIALVAVTPALLDQFIPDGAVRVLLEVARWAGLLVAVMVALAVLYRYAPDRDAPQYKWASVGAVVSTLIWLVASLGFSLYVDNFGSYGKTYGAMAGVVVLLLWLWITAFVVLLGAEINAEAEEQTVKDTTTGDPLPLGERNAVKADSVPGGEDAAGHRR